MTDREKLLAALLRESDRRVGAQVSVLDVIAMLDKLGAEHQLAVHHKLVPRRRVSPAIGRPTRSRRTADRVGPRT
jgi:hypothetical protein